MKTEIQKKIEAKKAELEALELEGAQSNKTDNKDDNPAPSLPKDDKIKPEVGVEDITKLYNVFEKQNKKIDELTKQLNLKNKKETDGKKSENPTHKITSKQEKEPKKPKDPRVINGVFCAE